MIWTALLAARSFLAKIPWPVWAIAAVLLTGWLYGNHRYSEGVADERAKWEAAAAKARAKAESANATAAETRIQDIVRNIDMERARNDAIDKAIPAGSPSTAPDAANRALGCQRLRASGQHAAAAKAGC